MAAKANSVPLNENWVYSLVVFQTHFGAHKIHFIFYRKNSCASAFLNLNRQDYFLVWLKKAEKKIQLDLLPGTSCINGCTFSITKHRLKPNWTHNSLYGKHFTFPWNLILFRRARSFFSTLTSKVNWYEQNTKSYTRKCTHIIHVCIFYYINQFI